jgi:GNAT superfamily N-acetyltransferase
MAAATKPWHVRDATIGDLDYIVEFNLLLAIETESKTLERAVLERGVRFALGNPENTLRYWVAEQDSHVLGMAGITREWSDWRNGWIWWYQSVYVSADVRGSGVFRSIFAHIRDAALAERDVIGLRLYVENANDRAKATYRAMGLEPGGYEVFQELWPERYSRPE